MAHAERLTKLADLMDVTPPEKFDITSWCCGTAACAVGTACLNPWFNSEGLSFRGNIPCYKDLSSSEYAEVTHWTAVSKFFEISLEHAHYLFLGVSYVDDFDEETDYEEDIVVTPAQVAERIREFIVHEI